MKKIYPVSGAHVGAPLTLYTRAISVLLLSLGFSPRAAQPLRQTRARRAVVHSRLVSQLPVRAAALAYMPPSSRSTAAFTLPPVAVSARTLASVSKNPMSHSWLI